MKYFHQCGALILLGLILMLGCQTSFAQETFAKKSIYVYDQEQYPVGFDNYLSSIYYYNGSKTFNLRGYTASVIRGNVASLKINPSGSSYAVLYESEKGRRVDVYKLYEAERLVGKIKKVIDASAVTYTADARTLVVATTTSLLICDAQTCEVKDYIPTSIVAKKVIVSPNNYYVAATDGVHLVVWDMEAKEVRKVFNSSKTINDIDFSEDSRQLAILTSNVQNEASTNVVDWASGAQIIASSGTEGALHVVRIPEFKIDRSYPELGSAVNCTYNDDNKYVAVVCNDTRIAVLNLLDVNDRTYIDSRSAGVSDVHFMKDFNNEIFIIYNALNNITLIRMDGLTPNYTKRLTDELNGMMNDWMKQMPDESFEEYHLRVNDETRVSQMRLFEQEIATRMAEDVGIGLMPEITLGEYSSESNMLSLNLGDMPAIYLEVMSEDIAEFADVNDLEIVDAKYGLTDNDQFELIYASVRNKVTGKTFTYDNLERRNIEYLDFEADFVPLEIIHQSNMQEIKLQEIKDDVVTLAKEQNTISDHTNIAVKTHVDSDTDARGEKIMNYAIDFSYTVELGFSYAEDFGPGKYITDESGAAMSMVEIIKQALEGEFAQYVQPGKKLNIKITGMADALPITGKISYDGRYGEYEDEPIYKSNVLSNITLTKSGGITQNEQLAFARALGVKDCIANNIDGLSSMDISYDYNIELSSGKGGEYRRINVQLIFIDAF